MSARTRQRPERTPGAAQSCGVVGDDVHHSTPPGMTVEAEVVDILDSTSAQALVERIDAQTATVNTEAGALIELCAEALRGKAWIGAGFGSWVELCEARGWEFNPRTSTDRAALAQVMRESGMSFRAIGKLVGADAKSIRNDLSGGEYSPPDDTVTGADGKQYPSRRTVADTAEAIGGDDLADEWPPPAPRKLTDDELYEQELRDGDKRAADRLRLAMSGWDELSRFRKHKRRDEVLALLTDRERAWLDHAEDHIVMPATSFPAVQNRDELRGIRNRKEAEELVAHLEARLDRLRAVLDEEVAR